MGSELIFRHTASLYLHLARAPFAISSSWPQDVVEGCYRSEAR